MAWGVHDFVLDGPDTENWFSEIDTAVSTPASVQHRVAALLVEVVRSRADRAEILTEIPHVSPGMISLPVPRTRIYVHVRQLGEPAVAAFVAVTAHLLVDSPTATISPGLAAALWGNAGRLTQDELEVFKVVFRLANDTSEQVKGWVAQEDIVNVLSPNHPRGIDATLASLKSRGLVEQRGALWREIR